MGESFFDSLSQVEAGSIYGFLSSQGGIREAVVLHTCNRFEIYFHPGTFEIIGDLDNFLRGKLAHFRIVHGDETVRHLFEVAAGLNSMVTGEDEILGQVREAWAASKEHSMSGPAVDELFSKAIEVGRFVRSSTGIGRVRRSVSREAVDAFEECGGRGPVLVIGAGQMGTKLARILAGRGYEVAVSDRTAGKGSLLAREVGGTSVPFSSADWARFPSIFTAVKSDIPLLSPLELEGSSAELIVDVSVPRAVVASRDGPRLVTMEDISRRLDRLNETRSGLAESARSLLNSEFAKYISLRNDARREELLRKLYLYTDDMVREQLAEIVRRAPLNAVQREVVEKGLLSQRSKLLSVIVQSLKGSDEVWDSDFIREVERMLDGNIRAR